MPVREYGANKALSQPYYATYNIILAEYIIGLVYTYSDRMGKLCIGLIWMCVLCLCLLWKVIGKTHFSNDHHQHIVYTYTIGWLLMRNDHVCVLTAARHFYLNENKNLCSPYLCLWLNIIKGKNNIASKHILLRFTHMWT